MCADERKEVRETSRLQAEVGDGSVIPGVLQGDTTSASNVDAVQSARHAIEAGGVDKHVQVDLAAADLNSLRGDPFDRRLADVDQLHVGLVVDLVVVRFHRHATRSESVVLGDQLLSDCRVLDPFTDLVGHELGDVVVGDLVRQQVPVAGQPKGVARHLVQ